nr:immunoglobulin light chain junction region [Macaca mulatta]
YQQDYTTPWTF